MKGSSKQTPLTFFQALQLYLTLNKIDIDTFLKHQKINNSQYISQHEFSSLTLKLISSLSISSINTKALSPAVKSNGSVDIQKLKNMYLLRSFRERSRSNSVDSKVSSRSRWRSSTQKQQLTKQKSKQLERAEAGLQYLLGCQKVRSKLRQIWQEVQFHRQTREGALNSFLCYCQIKQMSKVSVRRHICHKLIQYLLTGVYTEGEKCYQMMLYVINMSSHNQKKRGKGSSRKTQMQAKARVNSQPKVEQLKSKIVLGTNRKIDQFKQSINELDHFMEGMEGVAGTFTSRRSILAPSSNRSINKESFLMLTERGTQQKILTLPDTTLSLSIGPKLADTQIHQPQLSDYKRLYPIASKYYRLIRDPVPSQMPFLAELQILLRKEKVFSDTYNPTSKHQYLRASKIMPSSSYKVINGGFRHDSFKQGKQCNPNLSAILTLLAQNNPTFLSSSFILGVNPARYYCIRIFVNGQETIVKTDDRFPCDFKGRLVYGSSQGQIWGMLIEKVLAKILGGYQQMLQCSAEECLSYFTGQSTSTICSDNNHA